MPALTYRWDFRAHSVRGLEREHPWIRRHGARSRDLAEDGRCSERCEAAGLARPDERLRQAPTHLSLPQHANEPLAMSNSRAGLHVHDNGLGHLEVAVSLASLHFQHVGWK